MSDRKSMLLVAASRGLGLAMAEALLGKGWDVMGTVRAGSGRTRLHELADHHAGRLEIETVDISKQDEVHALRERLAGRTFDALFVNAGTTNKQPMELIGEVTTDEFVRVMVTNALSPMRVIEALKDLVPASGFIGAMSSGQGSVANNTRGLREVYRSSKAALNQLMRSFAARESEQQRAMLVMAPGWVKTELGGEDAPLTIADSIPNLVNVLVGKLGRPGLEYLDYLGRTVPW